MAPRNASRCVPLSSHPCHSPNGSQDVDPSRPITFKGSRQTITTTSGAGFYERLIWYPLVSNLTIIDSRNSIVNSKGVFEYAKLYISMFLMGLRLPFCHPFGNTLNFLGMTLVQLILNAQRIMLSCCIVWRQALEATREENPNLTAYEFFYIRGFRRHDGNQ